MNTDTMKSKSEELVNIVKRLSKRPEGFDPKETFRDIFNDIPMMFKSVGLDENREPKDEKPIVQHIANAAMGQFNACNNTEEICDEFQFFMHRVVENFKNINPQEIIKYDEDGEEVKITYAQLMKNICDEIDKYIHELEPIAPPEKNKILNVAKKLVNDIQSLDVSNKLDIYAETLNPLNLGQSDGFRALFAHTVNKLALQDDGIKKREKERDLDDKMRDKFISLIENYYSTYSDTTFKDFKTTCEDYGKKQQESPPSPFQRAIQKVHQSLSKNELSN